MYALPAALALGLNSWGDLMAIVVETWEVRVMVVVR